MLVKHKLPLGRPRLKTRRIARHSTEIAIMQPIHNVVVLANTRPALLIRLPKRMRSQRRRGPLLHTRKIIRIHEPRADEQDIADLDIPALCLGTDVDSLRLATRSQVRQADFVPLVRIVGSAGVAPVVEQDPAAADAVYVPVVDAAFVRAGGRTVDVGASAAIVEGCGRGVGDVAEAVPLCPGLRVERVDVVVGVVREEGLDGVLEWLAAKGRNGWNVERETGEVSWVRRFWILPYL
jgi:hypothetical protein